MPSKDWTIRLIKPEDNKPLALVLRNVLLELGVPKTGTAYADPELDNMYQAYHHKKTSYWVVSAGGKVFGGGGIAPLKGKETEICEFQKMYFDPKARGLGLGTQLLDIALKKAIFYGYSHCYLETMPYMKSAQQLYKNYGFDYLNQSLGNTGHFSCTVWMIKKLV